MERKRSGRDRPIDGWMDGWMDGDRECHPDARAYNFLLLVPTTGDFSEHLEAGSSSTLDYFFRL